MFNNCKKIKLEGSLDETMLSTLILTKLKRWLIARIGNA